MGAWRYSSPIFLTVSKTQRGNNMIHLVDIDVEAGNTDLEVSEEQRDYVCTSLVMLARAWLHRKFRPRVFNVYDGETAVGMGMYLDDPEKNAYDFCQLFIDKHYQGKGYGKAAVGLVLEAMKEEGKYPKVSMCYVEGNDASRKLFEQFGFVEVSHPWDEIFMERML